MHDKEQQDIIELMDDHLDSFVSEDEIIVFDDSGSIENHIDICWIKPNMEYRPYSILLTCGMSRNPMNVPKGLEDKKYLEIAMLLPSDWDLSDIKTKPDSISWPIHHMKGIGKIPVDQNTWIGFGHTIDYNKSKGDYFPDTKFTSSIILPSISLPENFVRIKKDNDIINIFSAIPIYKEELDYKLVNDTNSLIEKFNEFEIKEILDTQRINTCI
jgi:hypothetical protein